MGTWSMSPTVLNVLESEIRTYKPNLIVEFGSGLSTLCLAHYMRELHGGGDQTYVCSIEQDEAFVEHTLKRLKALQLDRCVRVFHAPLTVQQIEDIRTTCYALPREFERAVAALPADFVVIDGPAAGAGARFGTLPLLRPHLVSRARFYLDDALRDGELDIAERWARLPYVAVNGILLTEKGLLVGEINGGIS